MQELLEKFVTVVVNPLLQIAMIAALVVFLYGMFNFVRNADSSEARKTGQQHMMWGLVGLTIMVSAFAIIGIIIGTIGADTPAILE